MNVPAPRDTGEDETPAGWAVELTDLALLRVPHRFIGELDVADAAVIDGVRLRRHDGNRITVDGRGPRPRWLT